MSKQIRKCSSLPAQPSPCIGVRWLSSQESCLSKVCQQRYLLRGIKHERRKVGWQLQSWLALLCLLAWFCSSLTYILGSQVLPWCNYADSNEPIKAVANKGVSVLMPYCIGQAGRTITMFVSLGRGKNLHFSHSLSYFCFLIFCRASSPPRFLFPFSSLDVCISADQTTYFHHYKPVSHKSHNDYLKNNPKSLLQLLWRVGCVLHSLGKARDRPRKRHNHCSK